MDEKYNPRFTHNNDRQNVTTTENKSPREREDREPSNFNNNYNIQKTNRKPFPKHKKELEIERTIEDKTEDNLDNKSNKDINIQNQRKSVKSNIILKNENEEFNSINMNNQMRYKDSYSNPNINSNFDKKSSFSSGEINNEKSLNSMNLNPTVNKIMMNKRGNTINTLTNIRMKKTKNSDHFRDRDDIRRFSESEENLYNHTNNEKEEVIYTRDINLNLEENYEKMKDLKLRDK